MRQLTSLDASFLALENSRQTGHVGSLALLDASTAPNGVFGIEQVTTLLSERAPQLPPLRWRLATVPLGLDHPYWVEEAEIDLGYHVRELALASPGTDAQLAEQVARIISRPLDRARPLWELYVIEGHESGYVGVLTKIHHAVIDGLSGAEIMALLLDLTPEKRVVPAPDPEDDLADPPPTGLQMLTLGMLGLPRFPFRMLRSLPKAIPNLEDTPFAVIPGAGTLSKVAGLLQRNGVQRPDMVAPRVVFSGRISPHRRWCFGQLPLDEFKVAKNKHGATVNDVVVSVCAGAVRRWLLEHDDLPESPLVAQVPVSVRTEDQFGTFGNRILLMAAPLYTDEPDPVERLRKTHEALADMKERHRALPAALLQDANNFIPPSVFSRAARLTFAFSTSPPGRPTWNMVISNVPGPQFPLYMAGARLEANYPVSVITDGMGLNITVMSYMGHMDFGIVADRDQMPDLDVLMDFLREELQALED
jgi:WS/DGAT/MGAT family acyltransferase